jgi:hypothetical protein
LLAGLLFDATGQRMTPSHAVKKGARYRYYVSRPFLTGRGATNARGQRIPAVSLEALVSRRIQDWLADGAAVLDAIRHPVTDGNAQQRIIASAARLAASWQGLRPDEARGLLLSICRRVQVHADRVDLTIDRLAFIRRLEPQMAAGDRIAAKVPSDADASPLLLTIPARLRRAGIEVRMVVDDGSEPANVDPGLVRVLVRAFAIRDQLFNDHGLSLSDVAEREGIVPSYATRLYRLTFLAPDIIATILDGRHPPELTVRRLLDDTRLPFDWSEQRARLGFA